MSGLFHAVAVVLFTSVAPPEDASRASVPLEETSPSSMSLATPEVCQIVPLRYADAVETAGLLVQATHTEGDRSLFISGDKRLNAIVLRGSAAQLTKIRSLIEVLDQPAASPAFETRLEISVFEVVLSAEQAATLEISELKPAATSTLQLQQALGYLGVVRLLHRTDQTASTAGGNKWANKTNAPFVRGTMIDSRGQEINQLEYEKAECRVEAFGAWAADDSGLGHATVRIEISTMGKSALFINEKVVAPVFHSIQQQYDGPIAAERPCLLLSMVSAGKDEAITAYVTRLVFRRVAVAAD